MLIVCFVGDGFAFVVQNVGPDAFGETADGGSGYHAIPNSFAVDLNCMMCCLVSV
jgi:hypothetical protein